MFIVGACSALGPDYFLSPLLLEPFVYWAVITNFKPRGNQAETNNPVMMCTLETEYNRKIIERFDCVSKKINMTLRHLIL
jgi:hypothetical protein